MKFAKHSNNLVTDVVLVENKSETEAKSWLESRLGGEWHLVPEGSSAFIGGTFDVEFQKYVPAKPYESWIFNKETWQWESPVELPEDSKFNIGESGKFYFWDEELGNWVEDSDQTK